ncbi:MAG: isoaspartyl peptidase/L-asparaginase family protein, partial [Nitrospira sp.]|nr:isoaspartyl peptidase/L-asparaginase family protein [Nitrospira sp.]
KTQKKIVILVHGGAGERPANKTQLKILEAALQIGFSILKNGGSSLDTVETVIRILEDSGQFNAGKGSRLQLDKRCRMDASIMEGQDLKAGAVAGIEDIKNPIQLARLVMEKTPHVLMVGQGANQLAQFFKIQKKFLPSKTSLNILSKTLKMKIKVIDLYKNIHGHETVGAVAMDQSGTLAAGASTGGAGAMLPGRIGDSPLIGSGVYADNEAGAVSMTGLGEGIIRAGLAKEICCDLQHGMSPQRATEKALKRLIVRIHGEAGAIVLNRKGEFALLHTTPYMCAGFKGETKQTVVSARFKQILSRR